ncbi:MAG: hypothetical protein ACRD24_05090 [Terriglobales bacterium]
MNHKFLFQLPLVLFALATAVGSYAQEAIVCPAPANLVKVKVDATVTFDAGTQLYTYEYTVSNDATSPQEVADFAVSLAPPISEISNPPGWISDFFGLNQTHDPSVLGWNGWEHAPLPEGVERTVQIRPGRSQIKPGTSLSGFSFKSSRPPGPVRFFAQGFVQPPVYSDEEAAETAAELCPRDVSGDFFDTAMMGSTLGPVSFRAVSVDIKPDSSPNVLNPRESGVLPVAILATADFDAGTVDASSVGFGPGQAQEVHGRGHIEDVNHDGRPDMLLHFDVLQSRIRCSDTAAFLTGRTLTGQTIQGADSFTTVGCNNASAATVLPSVQ